MSFKTDIIMLRHCSIQKNNKYESALEKTTTALTLFKTKWKNKKHSQIAQAYDKVGSLYFDSGQPELAIPQYDLALEQFTGIDMINTSINRIEELKIFNDKAIALNALASKKNNTIIIVEKAIGILDSLKSTFKTVPISYS